MLTRTNSFCDRFYICFFLLLLCLFLFFLTAEGAFVGDMGALLNETPLTTTLICQEAGAIFSISQSDLLKFFDDNPGFRVFFMNRRFVE